MISKMQWSEHKNTNWLLFGDGLYDVQANRRWNNNQSYYGHRINCIVNKWKRSTSPEEHILCILCWITITYDIILHLQMWISSGDENIEAGCKVNPQSYNENTCVIVHMIHSIDFGVTLSSASMFSSRDEIEASRCNIVS